MHQLFIATSLQLLLPVIQTNFFSVPRFSIRRNKNPQKLNVIFLDQNRRNFTPQKLPVIRYIIGTAFIRHDSCFHMQNIYQYSIFFYWKKHSRGVIYILRQYSVSKSYSLKLSVTRLYRDIYSFLCNVITF